MPLISTRGAASAQGFGEFAQSAAPVYIEDVFSTYLYTGNGSTQTITNGIDLSTKGGLVWTKNRTSTTAGRNYHRWNDSARGVTFALESNLTDAQDNLGSGSISSFNTTGYTLGGTTYNNASDPWVSWTFRKQPKFFDVVTYTGNGSNRTISHNLGSVPGCIIVKRTDTTADWQVYHRSIANTEYLVLNTGAAKATGATRWNSTTPTSTEFSLGTDTTVNASGGTYVAYLYAHDAGGFGLSGTDNVISCGSFTSTGSVLSVNLGYEPQWLLYKESSTTGDWKLIDNMRGFQVDRSGSTVALYPNLSSAESALGLVGPTSTGFTFDNGGSGVTYIYIAIRRGPMKVPTSGTSVFAPNVYTNPSNPVTSGFPVDLVIQQGRNTDSNALVVDRLRGTGGLVTQQTNAENGYFGPITGVSFDRMTSFLTDWTVGASSYAGWAFRRAPGFFDEVCYTGTGAALTLNHNLGVTPELMMVRWRSGVQTAANWFVYSATVGNTKTLYLNLTTAASSASAVYWNNTSPTATTFTLGSAGGLNTSGSQNVAYLFATCPGVSKVGSYTGTGTTKQIDCGFTAGARFVLIKRTDSTGSWYCWDSARGIVAGNDPYLLLNSTAAEVTGTDYIDTYSAGFEITSTAPAEINASGGTFVFLSIA